MTRVWNDLKREWEKRLLYCYICFRVLNCENKKGGGQIRDCENCSWNVGCVGGCRIENVSDGELVKNAKAYHACRHCKAKRMANP